MLASSLPRHVACVPFVVPPRQEELTLELAASRKALDAAAVGAAVHASPPPAPEAVRPLDRHVRTIAIPTTGCYGISVNSAGTVLAVAYYLSKVYFYRLVDGTLTATSEAVKNPWRICFTPSDTLLVVERELPCLKELSRTGELVRTIELPFKAWSICFHTSTIAISSYTNPCVHLLNYRTGAVERALGTGQFTKYIEGLRFTRDGSQVVAVENTTKRIVWLSVVDGSIVGLGGGGGSYAGNGDYDVEIVPGGDVFVVERHTHRISVLSSTGAVVKKVIGVQGKGNGQFSSPTALAYHSGQLFVLDAGSERVQVFE